MPSAHSTCFQLLNGMIVSSIAFQSMEALGAMMAIKAKHVMVVRTRKASQKRWLSPTPSKPETLCPDGSRKCGPPWLYSSKNHPMCEKPTTFLFHQFLSILPNTPGAQNTHDIKKVPGITTSMINNTEMPRHDISDNMTKHNSWMVCNATHYGHQHKSGSPQPVHNIPRMKANITSTTP